MNDPAEPKARVRWISAITPVITWSAFAGIASPIVLATTTMFVASARPEYSHLTQTLSELGTVGRRGAAAMNWLGVIPSGALVLVSAPGLYAAFGASRLSAAAAILLGAGGACLGATGLTPWQGGLPADLKIAGNVLHLSFALAGFALIGMAPLMFGLHARRVPGLRKWSTASLAAAAATFAFAFWPVPGSFVGAFQRAALIVFFTWLSMSCAWIWLHRRDSK